MIPMQPGPRTPARHPAPRFAARGFLGLVAGATALSVTLPNPAHAAALADALAAVAGVYAQDCADAQSPSVVLGIPPQAHPTQAPVLQLRDGPHSMTATALDVITPADTNTASPPVVAVQGSVQDRATLSARVYGTSAGAAPDAEEAGATAAQGRWLELDGDPVVRATLGPLAALRYVACEPAATADEAARLRDNPAFMTLWRILLADSDAPGWATELNGPALPLSELTIVGTRWSALAVCKAHDCHDQNLVALYAPRTGTVYALQQRNGWFKLLGAPPAPVTAQLVALWRTSWHSPAP